MHVFSVGVGNINEQTSDVLLQLGPLKGNVLNWTLMDISSITQ